jgi:hypothetical protein
VSHDPGGKVRLPLQYVKASADDPPADTLDAATLKRLDEMTDRIVERIMKTRRPRR